MTATTQLVRYEAARAAVQAAHDVDEVKDIRDKAQAMAAYAKQANDTQMLEWVTEIKVRAERRAGEMLSAMKVNGSRHTTVDNLKIGPKSHDTTSGPTLDSIGISKDQSSRWQKLAAIPEKQFEEAVAAAKEVAGEVTTAALLKIRREAVKKPAAPKKSTLAGDAGKLQAKVAELQAVVEQQQEALAELADTDKSLEAFKGNQQFEEMQVLRVELRTCKRSRDEYMRQCTEMKKEVARWKKKAEKK